jgi:hypothetical protein
MNNSYKPIFKPFSNIGDKWFLKLQTCSAVIRLMEASSKIKFITTVVLELVTCSSNIINITGIDAEKFHDYSMSDKHNYVVMRCTRP